MNKKERDTLCGTLEYLSPEMVKGESNLSYFIEGYDYSIDIWAFGVLIFEVCTGNPPFQSAKDSISNRINYPKHLSVAVVDLIDNLLV
jgi:serine/threonine protein kinase